MNTAVTGLFLAYNAWKDFRKKEISLISVFLFGGFRIVKLLCGSRESSMAWILGAFFFFFGLSLISGQGLGLGDVWVILVMSMSMSAPRLVFSVAAGFLAAGISGLLYEKSAGTSGKEMELPFVPFLLGGYVLAVFAEV